MNLSHSFCCSTSWIHKLQLLLVLVVVVVNCRVSGDAAATAATTTSSTTLLSTEEWESLVHSLKGDDTRLFRWDATEHTEERQDAGDCDKLTQAATWLVDTSTKKNQDASMAVLVLDYLTLCITNHPLNRAKFGQVPGIHEAVIELVPSSDPTISALASHLVYISTYSNDKNHQSYFVYGAVPALAKVILDDDSIPLQNMWAACALQNLAASYCETEGVGTCSYDWTNTKEHIQLSEDIQLHSDATDIRRQILFSEGLVDRLIDLACQHPIVLDEDEHAIMPGSTALAGEHEEEAEIVTWAAMGTLKNLALEPTAKFQLNQALVCACNLRESPDWLEASKASDFLYYMRRAPDPCWVQEDGVCVDDNLLDNDMYHCGDYVEATEEDCEREVDVFTGKSASELCCGCGGGAFLANDEIHEEL